MADRDSKGRFLHGNSCGGKYGSGRPPLEHTERLRAALSVVIDDLTLEKWAAAIKKRIEAGDLDAAAFVFDRLLGKPVQMVDLAADVALKLYEVVSPDDWPSVNDK